MRLQGTAAAVPTCMAAPMEFGAAPPASTGGLSACEYAEFNVMESVGAVAA